MKPWNFGFAMTWRKATNQRLDVQFYVCYAQN